MALPNLLLLLGFVCFSLFFIQSHASIDYSQALTKSLLFFEGQRSGKLPPSQRLQWRGDSALKDGSDNGIDLTGGYYDAGDNVKFGFPHAFTITTLAWGIIEFEKNLVSKNELGHAMEALKWGCDYFLKAHVAPDVLYVEVGDGDSDHECWMRPEDMTTPRTSYRVDAAHPGSDVAGETSAALAAASIAFRKGDPHYADVLLAHAKQLFQFANEHRGLYQQSVPVAGKYYSSSGFDDEYQWAAVWLFHATDDKTYSDYLVNFGSTGGVRSLFSWDDKWVGVQTIVTKLKIEQRLDNNNPLWNKYESEMVQFICPTIQKGNNNVKMSPGGMLWWQPWNNFQYTTSAMLVIAAHADHLALVGANLMCGSVTVTPRELIKFVQSQVNYILGANPKGMSYMVGFGSTYPVKFHHRAASMPSIKSDPNLIGCKDGFDKYFNSDGPNPNVLEGAVVGGPDANDQFEDQRSNYQQSEGPTVNNAPLVGVLARLAA
ncbi:Glycoside hydrolase family 9 protein [Dioscorea alata]|uniref:Glycoside hydrolase family 9 protein n=1 Tax=Dioscorea alata TaxID=55571 RepID=A0ACB7V335_DIOAL|nr:Glycoside hydrolase family 9 protein [Dioscorea alata]